MDIQLYPSQQRALMSPAHEILFGGAVGGGKSYLARVASIVYSAEVPGLITYLFRRTFKEVLANHIYTPGGYLEMLGPMIKDGDVIFSKSDFSFSFWNGSRIQLAHSQYESDIYSHQGAQIGFLIVDEATNFTPDMVRFIRTRVRLGSLQVPKKWEGLFPRILYTANPGGVGHSYFKGGFVDRGAPGKIFRADKDDGGMLREYIPSKLTDNKVMLKTDPDYGERLYGLGNSSMVTAMIEGDWNVVGGGAFSDLWKAEKIVIDTFDIPHTWKIDRAYDYGSSAPGGCLWFAETDGNEHEVGDGRVVWFPKGTLIVIGELYFANKKLEGLKLPAREQGRRIKQYEIDNELQGRVLAGPADNAIFHKDPGKKSIADDIALEGIFFIRSDKTPGSRITGVATMRQRLTNSLVGIEEPGFYVMRNCNHTIRTLPNLERDKNDPEDIDSSQEDHIWDIVRYRLLKAERSVIKKKVIGF